MYFSAMWEKGQEISGTEVAPLEKEKKKVKIKTSLPGGVIFNYSPLPTNLCGKSDPALNCAPKVS